MTTHSPEHTSFLPVCVIAVATCSLSVQFLLIKKLTLDNVPFFQVISLRGAVQAVACVPSFIYLRRPLRTVFGESFQETAWLGGLGLLSFGGVSSAFAALSLLDLAQMQVLQSTAPVMTALFAWVLVGERWHWNEFTSAGTTIMGVIFVAMPGLLSVHAASTGQGHSWRHDVGVLLTLTNSACTAGMYAFIRVLGTRMKVHFVGVTMFNGLVNSVLGFAASFLFGFFTEDYPLWLSFDDWCLALGVCFLSIFSQLCIIWGMQREKSALGSVVVQCLGPVFAFVLQIVFLPNEPIAGSTLAGFGIIFVGLVIAVYGKWYRERQEQKILPTTDKTYHQLEG
uniref:EamA domain-containing protein n=1 Tax=Noctiluca scintillans TaxID=2966 RepID=A0A7S1AM05_NOCSC|mmetsp:Transcript_51901/g.138382  ORF Transcript_51901/g.138382 Transcript_51901/m.138382 type:complete len:339 (+) Transcript_51901:38-1054(+)